MFRLNMFIIALFTSDVSFKHFSGMYNLCINYAVSWYSHLPVSFAAMFSQISCFLPIADNCRCISSSPIFKLDVWPQSSPNFGSFGHFHPLRIHPPFLLWSDYDWYCLARLFHLCSEQSCFNPDSRNALSNVNTFHSETCFIRDQTYHVPA